MVFSIVSSGQVFSGVSKVEDDLLDVPKDLFQVCGDFAFQFTSQVTSGCNCCILGINKFMLESSHGVIEGGGGVMKSVVKSIHEVIAGGRDGGFNGSLCRTLQI